jgi:DHA1 family inner membrane transport protein
MTYADHAPTLASGANIAAFNLGNALGAWIGGLTITAGLGYTSPLWAGSLITAGAVVVMAFAALTARRRTVRFAEKKTDRPLPVG